MSELGDLFSRAHKLQKDLEACAEGPEAPYHVKEARSYSLYLSRALSLAYYEELEETRELFGRLRDV